MMKICYVSDVIEGLHDKTGGAGQAARRILDLIRQNKEWKIHLVTTPINKHLNPGKNTTLHILKNWDAYLGKRIGVMFRTIFPFDWITYRQFICLLDKIKPGIIHIHHINDLSLALIHAAKKKKIPIIASVYDYWLFCPTAMLWKEDRRVCTNFQGIHCFSCLRTRQFGIIQTLCAIPRRMIFKYFISKIDRFIVLSESSRKILMEHNIASNRISQVRLPLEYEKSLAEKKSNNTLLYVGWLQPHKGLHILINAMAQVIQKKPNAKLKVVGSYEENNTYYQRILSLIRINKISNNITFEGNKKSDEIRRILRESNMVIIPEQWENMSPLFLTEAMAAEKPIIASKVGGIPELIENGKSGFLIDRKDTAVFADKIIWLFNNPSQANKMGKQARKRYLQLFNKKNIFNGLKKIYASYT